MNDKVPQPEPHAVLDDPKRVAAVNQIDEARAEASDTIRSATRLAATLAGAPFAQVSLISDTQFVAAACGMTYGPEQQHTPRADSLCTVTVAHGATIAIENAPENPGVASLPPVTTGVIGAYLGTPLINAAGDVVGALCVFDGVARAWPPSVQTAVADLAQLISQNLDLITVTDPGIQGRSIRKAADRMMDSVRAVGRPGLRVAPRYRSKVAGLDGGAWADGFAVSQHLLAFSVGLLARTGMDALADIALLRHAHRVYAQKLDDPADTLHELTELLGAAGITRATLATVDTETATVRAATLGTTRNPWMFRGGSPWPFPCDVSAHRTTHHGIEILASEMKLEAGDRLVLWSDPSEAPTEPQSNPANLANMSNMANPVGASEPEALVPLQRFANWCVSAGPASPTDDSCLIVIDTTW